MRVKELLQEIQREINRHSWATFSNDGVTVPGCLHCKKRINTTPEYIRHITHDVLPAVFQRIFPVGQ